MQASDEPEETVRFASCVEPKQLIALIAVAGVIVILAVAVRLV